MVISDGQAWSGVVEESLATVRARGIPVFVVGVGTTGGGIIPDPEREETLAPEIRSTIDRASLNRIATAGGGQYFELDRIADHHGDPFADSSSLAVGRLADEMRRQVTVALSGDGADEVFAGYDRYAELRLVSRIARLPVPVAPWSTRSRGAGRSARRVAGR